MTLPLQPMLAADELHGLVVVASELLLDVLLRVLEDDGLEVDFAGCVDSVYVTEGGCADEGTVLDLGELLVGV